MKKLLSIFLLFVLPIMVFTQTLLVPSQYITIQSAISASNNGDTVLIDEGTYLENINYSGKNIVVGSYYMSTGDRSYVESTIIDGNQSGSVVTFDSGETSSAKLIGLTIQNGYNIDGGGIFCGNSCSPSLENLNIINNDADQFGGGVYLDVAANATLKHCLISDNTASGSNGNGGGLAGVGLFLNPVIQNCTFANNSAWESGNGIYVNPANPNTTNIQIINSILWNNQLLSSGTYEEISSQQNGSTQQTDPNFTVSYSLVRGGWSGTAILNTNPLFVDPSNGNFNLLYQSPCVNAGNPLSIYNDPDGSISDLGAFPINTIGSGTTFSTIKSGDYFDPCIWSQNSVPSSGDSIYVNHNIGFSNNLYFLNNFITINSGVEMCGYSSIIVDWNTDVNVFGNLKSGNIQLYSNLNIWGNVTASSLNLSTGGSVNFNGGGLSFSSFTCSPFPNFTTLSPLTICSGDSALIFGSYVEVSGSYWDTIQALGGCDSILYRELIVQSYNDTISQFICDGDSLFFGNQYLSSDTLISSTFNSSIGCDSVVTIDFLLVYPTYNTISQLICEGDSLFFGNQYLSSDTISTYIFNSSTGCDSVVTIDLFLAYPTYDTIIQNHCNSDPPFIWDGLQLDSSGFYTKYYSDSDGCDSVVILDFTIFGSFWMYDTIYACDSYTWDSITYYNNAWLGQTVYTSVNGCDSTVQLNLIINNSSYNIVSITSCDSFDWDGVTYDTTDQYVNVYSTVNGCDSTVTLDLTINQSTTNSIVVSVCDSYNWDGVTYSSTGLYTNIYAGNNGCDSTVVLDLTITPPPIATIFYDGVFLTANNAANYYWNTGETNDFIQPLANGMYWCIIEDINGCISDTVFFEVINIVGVNDFTSIRELDVYPNPSRDVFNISFNSDEQQDLRIRIHSVIGAEVYSESKEQFVGEYTKQISLDNYGKGIYFLEIETDAGIINKKLIMQ